MSFENSRKPLQIAPFNSYLAKHTPQKSQKKINRKRRNFLIGTFLASDSITVYSVASINGQFLVFENSAD
jgi:hypothetical protein